jgi:hypothetical protein
MDQSTAQPAAPIPTVDLKAPLKIETNTTPDSEEPKTNYGEKLLFFGIIFCGVIVLSVVVIAFFWTQQGNQSQKVITVEQTK